MLSLILASLLVGLLASLLVNGTPRLTRSAAFPEWLRLDDWLKEAFGFSVVVFAGFFAVVMFIDAFRVFVV